MIGKIVGIVLFVAIWIPATVNKITAGDTRIVIGGIIFLTPKTK